MTSRTRPYPVKNCDVHASAAIAWSKMATTGTMNSGLRVYAVSALPASSGLTSADRGRLILLKGGSGDPDTLYIVCKDDTDAYDYRLISFND